MLNDALKDFVKWPTGRTEQLYKLSSPCLDGHNFKKEELETVGELFDVCSQSVFKCLYLARIGRADILWSVNKVVRCVTKWTRTCDKRLASFDFLQS